tara:strand:- start:67 stop:612 length:546 start_codon:yes stop_codon:yes gene_type:complete
MCRLFFIIFFLFSFTCANAENREKIIENLETTINLSFKFEQNINGKIENGECIIEYPKKIFCNYKKNNKILVSNGKSLVIKTITSYYRYPIENTPLNLILDKNFLINKLRKINEKIIDDIYINFTIIEKEIIIDVFFDINSFNIVGWQTTDIYQNKVNTLLFSISKNQKINKKLFQLPTQN